jgi:hypothetical protein
MGYLLLALLTLFIKIIKCRICNKIDNNEIEQYDNSRINNNRTYIFWINEKDRSIIKYLNISYNSYIVDQYCNISSIIINRDKINLENFLKYKSVDIYIKNSLIYLTDTVNYFERIETVNCSFITENNIIFPSEREIKKYYLPRY